MPAGQDPADPAVRLRLLDLLGEGSDTYRAAGEMLRAVRTGEPTAQTVFGTSFFEHLARDPERNAVLDQAKGGGAAARGARNARKSEWRSLLAAGGFALVAITPRPATNLIEAAPA